MLKFLRNKAGYGLIETIISICVLSTITITSMTLLTNMMSSLEFFRSNVVAQTLATSKVNLLSVADYASVANEARAQVDTTYKLDRELVVNEVDLGGGNKKKDITINIYKTGATDTLFTMNYTLASAGTAVVVPHGKQLFTASGTFTVPNGVTQVWVSLCGGGGSGGKSYVDTDVGTFSWGGGGGGAAAKQFYPVTGLTPGSTVPVTVGAAGGTSSFGSYVSTPGGTNGTDATKYVGNGTSGVAGGTGGTNSYTYQGGNSLFGTGGKYYGEPASGYGAGGGGYSESWMVTMYGGAGSPGMVLVEW